MPNPHVPYHLPKDTGPAYWGPGDRYTFLATSGQTDGTCFVFEALVPPGGGPVRHVHHREHESYYLIEGTLEVTLGDKKFTANAGDFVHIPKDTIHAFLNTGKVYARMLLICIPGGLEKHFEDALVLATDRNNPPDHNRDEVNKRYRESGPKFGTEYF